MTETRFGPMSVKSGAAVLRPLDLRIAGVGEAGVLPHGTEEHAARTRP